jgi:polyhydroxyalkanoate synthase subunit PhaC
MSDPVINSTMNPAVDPVKAALEMLDAARRRTGRRLDDAGFGPRTTPSTVIDVVPGVRLRTYPSADVDGSPVLLVPAPIKRSYLWDLEPDVSVVGRVIRNGLRPFLVEWTDVERTDHAGDADLGLTHYADTLLSACLDTVTAQTGSPTAAVAGHSLGGTLAAILAARRPERVAALVLLEAPLRFGAAAGSFAPLVAATPSAMLETVARGGVPGAFLDQVSALAAPREFTLERRLDLLRSISRLGGVADAGMLHTHLRVLRWASDEFRMPGALFRDVVERLYRDDAFAGGTLEIAGERVGPATLRAPLTTVFAPRSAVIPPSSVVPVHEVAAAPDKLLLEYGGDVGVALQHVGVLVGRSAHRDLWPRILDRLGPTG